MSTKEFKTIEEQISLLKERNLTIDDEATAASFLLQNNYYRVSGYSLTLRKNDRFSDKASFQNIVDIYEFDYELRHIILKYIEIIEIQMKSVYAYEFSRIYGPLGYLKESLFSDTNKYHAIMNKANDQKEKRLPHEAYLKHFINDLEEDIPLWAFVDLLTISDISFLYAISDESVKRKVAESFGLVMSRGTDILGKYMHSMTIIRNLCAHGSRIYNRLFEQRPSLNRKEKGLLRVDEKGEVDNSHFYGFVLVMKRMLSSEIFNEMKNDLVQLTEKYPFVRMDYYGFRDDWKKNL